MFSALLVGGWPAPLKNMSQLGWLIIPNLSIYLSIKSNQIKSNQIKSTYLSIYLSIYLSLYIYISIYVRIMCKSVQIYAANISRCIPAGYPSSPWLSQLSFQGFPAFPAGALQAQRISKLVNSTNNRYTKNYRKNDGKSPFWIGKSSINGVFSIAMLNYQRVIHIQHLQYNTIYYRHTRWFPSEANR